MKKIKLLTSIISIATIAPAMLVLTQCGNKNPTIDPAVADKVDIASEKDGEGNQICKVTLKTDVSIKNKIQSISISIGNNVLNPAEDYKSEPANVEGLKITIYKQTLDKYKGSIVITPTIVGKEYAGIIVEYKNTFKTKDTMTKNDIHIYKSYEGTKGEEIPWGTNTHIYENSTEITNFQTDGLYFTEAKTRIFEVKYLDYEKGWFTFPNITVRIEQLTHKLTYEVNELSCLKLLNSSQDVKDEIKWGEVTLPGIQPKDDVSYDTTYLNVSWIDKETEAEMDPDEQILKNKTIQFKCTNSTEPKGEIAPYPAYYHLRRSSTDTWIVPTAFYPQQKESPEFCPMSGFYDYTFDIKPSQTNYINYFWIIKNSSGYPLINLYKENIISIKVDDKELVYGTDYIFESWGNGGKYLTFKQKITFENHLVLKFRMLKDEAEVIPVLQQWEQ